MTFLALSIVIFSAFVALAHCFHSAADVSWVSQQEREGQKFYDQNGVETDPFVLLKNFHISAIRLRVWVNPAGGWCNATDTLKKAKRAVAQGMKILVDFHYADSWADPGKQPIPAAWTDHDLSQLVIDVYNHTIFVLNYLKNGGINVDYVQVGNEINNGMLWPIGSNKHSFYNLSQLLISGYNGVRTVFPNAQVILHLANAHNNENFKWWFDAVKKEGVVWDIIGMSHYPCSSKDCNWTPVNKDAAANMKDMVSRYNTSVVIAEIGYIWTYPEKAKAMITDITNHVRSLGSRGVGIFYWEPQCSSKMGYQMGALYENGTFTDAVSGLSACPQGWTLSSTPNSQTCYNFINTNADFTAANQICANMSDGATLASIDSAFENTQISNLVKNCNSAYIGLQKINNQWAWNNGDTSSYINWEMGNPVNDKSANCVTMKSSDGKWGNQNCDDQNCFVCKLGV